MLKSLAMDAISALTREFGLSELRPSQREAIEAFLAGRDVLLVLPTGGGKSLCYQLPALALARDGRGPTLVVSPLVALMDDQVQSLRERGVEAVALHSAVPWPVQQRALRDLRAFALVYVSPERLARERFRSLIARAGIARAVVDEAHCISEWGHDFRPEYRSLAWLKEELALPVMAATATATPRVQGDIASSLVLHDPVTLVAPALRENLTFSVILPEAKQTRTELAAELLLEHGFKGARANGRALVYAATRKRAEAVQRALRKAGIRAGYYHAGRRDSARARAHELFEQGKTPVLVATSAYGMGIDLPDVRLVVHVEAPGSLEAYVQQAGRAGRDGLPARCVLAYADGDEALQRRLWGPNPREGTLAGFAALRDYALGSACRRQVIAAHFGTHDSTRCGECDACSEPERVRASLERLGGTRRAKAQASREKAREESAYELSEDHLDRLVAFVDALKKPLGRRIVMRALRGSRARDVRRYKLTDNPHFAALREVPESAIFRGIDTLLSRALLVPKGKKYPTLWVAGKPVRGTPSARPQKPRGSPLELALRRFRRNEARRRKLKPYQVFQDKALLGLCSQLPSSQAELLEVWGMGEARVEKYGEALLEIVRTHRDPQANTAALPRARAR